jgi:hypothetical protein
MRIPALTKAFLLPGAQLYLCNRSRFIRCHVRRLLSRPNGIRHSIVTRARTGSFVSQYCCNECRPGRTRTPAFAEAKNLHVITCQR